MEELFVPYEIALLAKEKGFDKACFAEYRQWDGSKPSLSMYQDDNGESDQHFTTEAVAPLYQQLVDWFKEKHKIFLIQSITFDLHGNWFYYDIIKNNKHNFSEGDFNSNIALNKALFKAFKMIK